MRSAGAVCVGFVAEPLDRTAVKALMALRSDIDDFHVHGREVYWICRTGQGDSKFSNMVFERMVKARTTFRGVNTIVRLAAKYAGEREPQRMPDATARLDLLPATAITCGGARQSARRWRVRSRSMCHRAGRPISTTRTRSGTRCAGCSDHPADADWGFYYLADGRRRARRASRRCRRFQRGPGRGGDGRNRLFDPRPSISARATPPKPSSSGLGLRSRRRASCASSARRCRRSRRRSACSRKPVFAPPASGHDPHAPAGETVCDTS